MREHKYNSREIIIVTLQNKLTGINYPLLWLAKCKGYEVLCRKSSNVEEYCKKNKIKYSYYSLSKIAKFLSKDKLILTASSKETLQIFTLALALNSVKKIIKLKLREGNDFFDKISSKIDTGWIDSDFLTLEKNVDKKEFLTIVTRLKPGKNILRLLLTLRDIKINVKKIIRGDGELKKLVKLIPVDLLKLVEEKLREDEYINLLDGSEILLYPSHGTDLTCRTVLEAASRGCAVINFEPLAKKYIINGKTGYNIDINNKNNHILISKILLNRKLLRVLSLNAKREAKKYNAKTIPLPFL